jgi:hypothetical protein
MVNHDAAHLASETSLRRVIWLVRLTVRTCTYREVVVVQYASEPLLILQQRRTHVIRPSDGKSRIGISNECLYNVLQCTAARLYSSHSRRRAFKNIIYTLPAQKSLPLDEPSDTFFATSYFLKYRPIWAQGACICELFLDDEGTGGSKVG